jgi:hypothetical protein
LAALEAALEAPLAAEAAALAERAADMAADFFIVRALPAAADLPLAADREADFLAERGRDLLIDLDILYIILTKKYKLTWLFSNYLLNIFLISLNIYFSPKLYLSKISPTK